MSARRKKADAIDVPVPQNDDECDDFIALIGDAQSARATLQADLDREVRAVKARYEEAQRPHALNIERYAQGVQIFCAANRTRLTQDGKVKTRAFGAGSVSWRMRPAKVNLRGIEKVLEYLRADRKLARFVRTKHEVNKEALLEEPAVAETIPGVSIGKGEDFVIRPLETKLEESLPATGSGGR